MRLSGFTIKDVLYSRDDAAVALANAGPDHSDYGGDDVIVKFQITEYPSADSDARWKHEYQVLQTIESEYILRVLALEHHNNIYVLVLENFPSVTLSHFLRDNDLSLDQRLQIACRLVRALGEVHRHQIIHRDYHPGNVLINPETLHLKLCNFSLATGLRAKPVPHDVGNRWGAVQYMSPEQTGRTGLEVDYRSDFYSLGVTLFELFTGRLPFMTDDLMTLMHSHIAREPELLTAVRGDIPASLAAIVHKLLAKLPDERYQSSLGIQADLDECQQQWQQYQYIKAFAPGSKDKPQTFRVSRKLYGRTADEAVLTDCFERVSSGHSEMVVVAGYSGVGKTVLVQQLQQPELATKGFFISGKCDQYNRSQPYSALTQAFPMLIQQLLSEPEVVLDAWRETLTTALGNNAGVIVELLPELALITGHPPAVPPLPAAEAEARFVLAWSQFINALCSPERPLVLFLDDLQWAGVPTLTLLEKQLANHPDTALMVVGAYRSNEIDEGHPLTHTLATLEQGRTPVASVQLEPLQAEDIAALLADTLHCPAEATGDLTQLCLEKTHGNPFFLTQFLETLHDQGDIWHDHVLGCWRWNVKRIRQRDITDNVVDFMVCKLQQLNGAAQSLLAIAAHLGNEFTVRQLAAVCERDVIATAATLKPVLNAGFIVPLDDQLLSSKDRVQLSEARCHFLHDRVQQAAWHLTPDNEQQALQLRIGRHLLAASTPAEIEDNPFIVLQALNNALDLIDAEDERAQLVALNLSAGLKVKKAAAYKAAAGFLGTAQKLLPASAWTEQASLAFSIHKALAEAEYLAGRFEAADAIYTVVQSASQNPSDLVELSLVQAQQYQMQGRFPEAIAVMLASLQQLGYQFPENEEAADAELLEAFQTTKAALTACEEVELLTAGEMSDAVSLQCMQLHNALAVALYLVGAFKSYAVNACRMVQLTLEHGQCELSAIGYLTYATAMSSMGEAYPQCYRMGRLAKTMSDQWDNKYYRATTYQYFSSTYQHWCEPIINTFDPLAQVAAWGREGINLVYAGYSILFSIRNQLISGRPLPEIEIEATRGLAFLRKHHQLPIARYLKLCSYQSILALQGKTPDPKSLDSDSLHAMVVFDGDFTTPSIDLAFYSSAMIRHAYLMGDRPAQQQFVQNRGMIGAFLPDSPSVTDASFYSALILLNEAKPNDEDIGSAREYRDLLRTWAADSPQNFEHKQLLISAELARIEADSELAMTLYDQAIDAAEKAGFLQCQAIACERYARFWLARQQQRLAQHFIKEAHYHYGRWGASAKCMLIEREWPSLSGAWRNVSYGGYDDPTSFSATKVVSPASLLDYQSLLRANQLLSQEVNTSDLLKKMMEVLLVNAGAQHGGIAVNDEGVLRLGVCGNVDAGTGEIDCRLFGADHEVQTHQSVGTPEQAESLLPDAIIRYVQHTCETLLLEKPAEDQRFLNNAYLQRHRPKSVLCLPIIGQGRLIAIVYLENNLTEKTFTHQHKDTLELIAAQAAVSLVNARHYGQLEEKVRLRTEELHRLASIDALTGVANRREFDTVLKREWARSQRDGLPLSLLMIDIDHFKLYNDHYGHPVGDRCINAVAQALQHVVHRSSDLLARYGGEEFAILISGSKDVDILQIARNCLEAVRSLNIPHACVEEGDHVTISLGVCTMSAVHGDDAELIVTKADEALYRAKDLGRNRFCVAD
ncbi:diguanylate cyclase [Allohahella sp. A8]|uniref:diguanylate cyclase n=1 Tax=Allohahella sp. A8 TaxID=3141461 RepID=UPI003A7F825C